MAFGFMLENSIDSSDYLKIQLPFQIHTSLTADNNPEDLIASIHYIGEDG